MRILLALAFAACAWWFGDCADSQHVRKFHSVQEWTIRAAPWQLYLLERWVFLSKSWHIHVQQRWFEFTALWK